MDLMSIQEVVKKADYFSGVIHILEKGKTKLHISGGYADRSEMRLNQLDTAFGIASGTKGFTALGILKLIDVGKLGLEDDVRKILSNKLTNIKEKVTVKQLITHTSGIYDYFDEDVVEDFGQLFEKVPAHKLLGPSDMLPLLVEGESYFKPGEQFKYCNSGFVILGMIIEAISGMTYEAYMKKEVFEPLGLQATGCFKTNQLPKNTAYGWEQDDQGNWYSNIFAIPIACTADGGLFTTAEDVATMWNGFIQGDFISDDLKKRALSPQIKIPWGENLHYGFGFYLQYDDKNQLKNYFLVGEDPGVSFTTNYYVKEERILTILGNTSDSVWTLLSDIAEFVD